MRRFPLPLPFLILALASHADEPALPPGAAAVVNGESVPMTDLQAVLLKRHGPEALHELVLKKLLDQEVRKSGIQITDEEIARRGEEARSEIRKQYSSGVTLEDLLKGQGITPDEFREQVTSRLSLEKLVIRDLLCGEWVRLRVLSSSTEEKAKGLLESLRGGADFGELAKKESTDGCAVRGGELGVCFRGEMPLEMEAVVFTLSSGSLTGVLKTPAGFVIAKVEERQEAKPRPYAEIRSEVDRRLAKSPPAQEQVQRLLARMQRSARIQSSFVNPAASP